MNNTVARFYPAFLKEYHGQEYLETDHGFCTYVIINDNEQIFVENIYVAPEFRQTHAASNMLDYVVELGRAAGCKQLIGTVQMRHRARDISLMAALKYGFKLVSSNEERLVIAKEIGE